MRIYTLKIVLRGMSRLIWRRLKVPGPTSLADLHYIIQTIYGWDDENLHQFHIYGKDYGINYAGGIAYSEDALLVSIACITAPPGGADSRVYQDPWIPRTLSRDTWTFGKVKNKNGMSRNVAEIVTII